MPRMTHAEMKAMRGTEFIYIYPDGDTIRGYVKAYDKNIGLSCFSLSDKTDRGWDSKILQDREEDGTFCLTHVRLQDHGNKRYKGIQLKEQIAKCQDRLEEIRDHGRFTVPFSFGLGQPSCGF